jgi:hypothetical protein
MGINGKAESTEMSGWVPCRSCNAILPFAAEVFPLYFSGRTVECPRCNSRLSWWDSVVDAVLQEFNFGQALVLAGTRAIALNVELISGETTEVDLTAYGVPEQAEILYLNLTPNGTPFPIIQGGNTPNLGPIGPRFHLYGRHYPDWRPGGKASLFAIWFAPGDADTTVRHLVDAARQYEAKRYEGVVVPANIAIEAAVTPLVALALRPFAGEKRLKEFLKDGATYSHQLNVLLPLVAHIVGVPTLDDRIRGILNRIRSLRNDVAHTGACKSQTRRDAAEHLAAVIFGMRHLDFLRDALHNAREHGKFPRDR